MRVVEEIRLTSAERGRLYLLLVILRWLTCDHPRMYWANGVDGYVCPTCGRCGYGGDDLYDPSFQSS